MSATCPSLKDVGDVIDRLSQITECSICAETFVDPRVLPCIHTYCFRCLETAANRLTVGPGQTMACPLCRDEFVIPQDGIAGVRKNFFMVNLIEMSMISSPPQREKLCELCLETREDPGVAIPAAATYCVECRQRFCETCTKEHRRQRLSRTHQILRLGTPLSDELAKQFGPNYCEFHPGKATDLYCASCKAVICMMCYAESHNTHLCTDVIKKADNFRLELGEDIGNIATFLGKLTQMKTLMDADRDRFLKEIEDCRARVVSRSEELKETLERHTKALLDELTSLQVVGLEEYSKETGEMDRYLNTMNDFKSYCEEMRSRGTPSDVCISIEDLHKRTGDLKDLHDARIKRPMCTLNVSFRVTENEDYVNSHPNMVGDIKGTATKIRNIVVATNNLPVNSRLIGRLDIADRRVNGIASLDRFLYVLLSDGIRVFEDKEPFKPTTQLAIPGMKSLVDIAACNNYMCLFATDKDKSCIWRLTIEHKASIFVQGIEAPHTLSVTRDGKIVTVRWGAPSTIEIYGTDGNLCDTVTLDAQIVLPCHAVQTSTGSLVVSHGGKDNRTHRVLEVSLQGNILRSFPEENPRRHLNCPLYLALDEDDRVFVADYYNGVVLLLQQELDLDRVLALEEKDGVRRPIRLCYLAGRNILLVINGNKFVDIYVMERTEPDPVAFLRDMKMDTVTKRPMTKSNVSGSVESCTREDASLLGSSGIC